MKHIHVYPVQRYNNKKKQKKTKKKIENRNFIIQIRNSESALKNRNKYAKIVMVGRYVTLLFKTFSRGVKFAVPSRFA